MQLFTSKFRGYFNKYQKNMPIFEVIMKDANYLLLRVYHYFKNGFKDKSILVYPHYPSRGSTLYKISKRLGYNITNKPKSNIKFAVYWEYLTYRQEYQMLEELSANKQVINLYSRDIGKLHIDKIHKDIFGYSTVVDPLNYTGKIVKKSDINAKHDGTILQAPINSIDESCIYQILIDNTVSEKLVMDIRVPVVGAVLEFVYIKYRDISERFKNTTIKTEIAAVDSVFDIDEIRLLNAYCKELRLDFGELDVLRNNDDKKIYVVDINNTPQGPPANISKEDAEFAMNEISYAFEKFVLEK